MTERDPAVSAQEADYDIPPVTLYFGYFERMSSKQRQQANVRFREMIQAQSQQLNAYEAGQLAATIRRGLCPTSRGLRQAMDSPAFEYHPGHGLTYRGGSGSDFLRDVDLLVTEPTVLCLLDVFGTLTEPK